MSYYVVVFCGNVQSYLINQSYSSYSLFLFVYDYDYDYDYVKCDDRNKYNIAL